MLDRSLKITEHQWNKEDNALLYVQVLTYNHESYIKECIEGILMQETTFPIHIVVFEDCSTDKTAEILKEYKTKHPKLFTLYLQPVNTYGKDIRQKALQPWYETAKKGKYIAKCEGDDYWTDPLKLQKQVDFLEGNEDCSLVFTGCEIKKANGENRVIRYPNLSKIGHNEYLTKSYFMTTASLLFRNEVIDTPTEEWMSKSFAGDFILRYRALTIGKIGYINDLTCVYNKGVEGSWTNRKLTNKTILKEYSDNMRGLYYLNKYKPIDNEVLLFKIKYLKKSAYFKTALSKGGLKGLLFLIYNLNNASFFYIAAYIKQLLRIKV